MMRVPATLRLSRRRVARIPNMRRALGTGIAIGLLALAYARPADGQTSDDGQPAWQPAGSSSPVRLASRNQEPAVANELPREHGQVWRQYDITDYTSRAGDVERPEQAVIDWILRETGTDAWFSEPLGLLNVNGRRVSVYHTPEMQRVVADLVQRMNEESVEPYVYRMRILTIANPNWRGQAMRYLRRVPVQTPGVDAWLLSKEDASVLTAELLRRMDAREYTSPNLVQPLVTGQSLTIRQTRPRSYIRSLQPPGSGSGPELGHLDEGFSLEFSPLLSEGGATVDAVIRCEIDQVERFAAVNVPAVPGTAPTTRVQIEVPQIVSWRLHERFRWPTSQVLLLTCGIVATPAPDRATTLGLRNPFQERPGRADALLFLEVTGKASQSLPGARSASRAPANNRY